MDVTWGRFLLSTAGTQHRFLVSAHPLALLWFYSEKKDCCIPRLKMEGPCEFFFLEGTSLLVFDCIVKVRRSFGVSSIEYRTKSSRHRLESLCIAFLDEDVFLNQCLRSWGDFGVKEGNAGALLCSACMPPGQPGPMAPHCTSELAAKFMLALQAALIFCSLKTVLCFPRVTPLLIFLGCWQMSFRVPNLNTLYWLCLACLGLSELWWFVENMNKPQLFEGEQKNASAALLSGVKDLVNRLLPSTISQCWEEYQ